MKSHPTTSSIKLLNAEQIAARRIPIEDAEINLDKKSNWQCSYCSKRFNGENTFMRHFCEPKRRTQELMSPLGQSAFGYYREWMRMKKFGQPGAPAFMESKYYRSFINFAQLVIDANVAKPERFIELMVAGEILPVLWCRDSAYAIYLGWLDKLANPLDLVQESISYLMDICDKDNVQLDMVFEHLGPQQVLSLIRQHRLTPWMLFCSTSFKNQILKKLDSSQLIAFNAVVNSTYWSERFKVESGTLEQVKMIVREIGL